jgi:hypothetical protein
MESGEAAPKDAAAEGAVDPRRCPLCGRGNECGQAAGAKTCWCFTAVIPADVLAQVPERARNAACVCRTCATRATPER